MSVRTAELLEAQKWRTDTPGHDGWARTARPGDPNKYFVVSADTHAILPKEGLRGYLDRKHVEEFKARQAAKERERDDERKAGVREPKPKPKRSPASHLMRKEDFAGEDLERQYSGRYADQRVSDQARDGVDAEVIYGLAAIAGDDAEHAMAVCRAYNNWARDWYGEHWDRQLPMAFVTAHDVGLAVAEIERVAALGFKGINLPNKPIFGPQKPGEPNYNLPEYEPLFAACSDAGLPVTFHVSSGRSSTTARGPGGAIANYVAHCCITNIEPLVLMCSSGLCEKYPGLRFALVECGIGWVAWTLDAMDEVYRKHHMWAKPKLKEMPSVYFRRQGFATFGEDRSGLALAEEFDLVDNFMWANDYPHPEGSWPHSPEAIERQMGRLTDDQRAKVLGLNAARLFGISVDSVPGQLAR